MLIEGKIRVEVPFDFYVSVTSGQSFRWGLYDERGNFRYAKRDSEGYMYAPLYGIVLGIKQEGKDLYFRASSDRVYVPHRKRYMSIEEFLPFYFSLDAPVEEIEPLLKDKPELLHAYRKYIGVRILRQEATEILITFIFSAQNTVKNIARTVNNLSLLLSEPIDFMGMRIYPFPHLSRIANTSFDLLRRYLPVRFDNRIYALIEASRRFSREDIYRLHSSSMDYGSAHRELLKIKGVGPKIADCVLLFSLEHWEAFPVDVHIRRMVEKYFGDEIPIRKTRTLTNRVYREIGEFFRRKYGRWAGWIQQYMYSMSRTPEGARL